MGEPVAGPGLEGLQSSLFFETPEEIYARVFRELKPRTVVPEMRVEFCRFANADSFIRLEDGRLLVRISDILAGAPAPVTEALAYILLGKLYRKPVARVHSHRYRLYLNRRDVRRQAHLMRQIRGRKFVSGPQGDGHNLEEVFERLNREHFDGLMGMPRLGWSRGVSRSMGPLRSIPQRHHHQPDSRSRGSAVAGAGVRDVSRDAAPALSGRTQWSAAEGTHEGVQGSGEEVSEVEGSEGNAKGAVGAQQHPPLQPPANPGGPKLQPAYQPAPGCATPGASSRTS